MLESSRNSGMPERGDDKLLDHAFPPRKAPGAPQASVEAGSSGTQEEKLFLPSQLPIGEKSEGAKPLPGKRLVLNPLTFSRFNERNIERIYRDYVNEGNKPVHKRWLAAMGKFIKSNVKEKVDDIIHIRRLARSLRDYAGRHGRPFLIYATVCWLLDDFIVPAALWLMKLHAAAAFVLVAHFEWITWPSYFIALAILRKTIKKRMRQPEYNALVQRVQKTLQSENSFRARAATARDLLRSSGPYMMGLFYEQLSRPFDPQLASKLDRLGAREQAAKYLGRTLRDTGVKSEPARYAVRLIQTRTDDADPWVRKVAIGAIGKFAARLSIGQVLEAYDAVRRRLRPAQEPEAIVRGAAARSMGAFASEGALQELGPVLDDMKECAWNRKYAAESIGNVLAKLPFDKQTPVTGVLAAAVARLRQHSSLTNEPNVDIRSACMAALTKFPLKAAHYPNAMELSKLVIERLRAGLEDPDATVRETALNGLARRYLCDGSMQNVAEFAAILAQLMQGSDPNLAELSYRYYKYLRHVRFDLVESAINSAEAERRRRPPTRHQVRFIDVEGLYDNLCRDKVRQLDSPAVQRYAEEPKSQGHVVCYSRNFLRDRSGADMNAAGEIDIFNQFDGITFGKVIAALRDGKVARVPRIDFLRGRVAGFRTLVPQPGKDVVVLGSAEELKLLSQLAGLDKDPEVTFSTAALCAAAQS